MARTPRFASASVLAAAISLALIQQSAAQNVPGTAGLDANGLTLDPQQADRLQRRTVSTLPFQYTGSNARISLGVDDELQLTGEGLGIFGFDGTKATLLEGWLGRHGAGGVKLGYHWLWGGATREDTLGEARDVWVAKVFGAVDRNEFHDRKATLGAGLERNNRFLDLYYEHALSDARRTSSTSDSVTDTVFGQEPDGREFQQDITTTTLVEGFAVPYEHGVGFRVGRYFEYPMLRLRGGLDYAWGDDLLQDDHARQLGATVSLEKFIEDTGHSLALELGYFRKNGPFDSERFGHEDDDLRVALQWRYELGQAHRRTVTDAPDAASERPAPWVERALRNLPQHRRQVDTYAAQRTTVTTAEGEKVYLNRAPLAQDDAFTTPSGTLLSRLDGGASLLGNDTDPDGDPLTTVQLVTGVSNGTLFIASDGGFEYTPNAGFSGTDTFTYTVKDTAGAVSNVATVTITVQESNNGAPVANDDTAITVQANDAIIDVLANDTDPDGDTVLVDTITQQPAHGTLIRGVASAPLIYRPDPNFVGTDTFKYTATDGFLQDEATVTISVQPAGTGGQPIAVADFLDTDGAPIFVFPFSTLLSNDANVPAGAQVVVASLPLAGTLFVDSINRIMSYTPEANFQGDVTFTYRVCDANLTVCSPDALVTITVSAPASNQPPVAGPAEIFNATAGVQITGDVLDAQDTDPNPGDTLHVELVTDVVNGTLVLNPDGTFTYTADATFTGTDTFIYVVEDQDGARSQEVTVTINVTQPAANLAPVAVDDELTGPAGSGPISFNVLTNDQDPEVRPMTIEVVTNFDTVCGSNPLTSIDPDGSVIFTLPTPDFTGTCSFTYRAVDDQGLVSANVATVTITISPPAANLPPDAVDDLINVPLGTTGVVGNLLQNDSDPNADVISILVGGVDPVPSTPDCNAVLGTAGGGSINLLTGDVTIGANAVAGTCVATYTISDGRGGTDTATATINVTAAAANQPPIADNDTFATPFQTTLTGVTVFDGDSDPDGNTFTAELVTDVAEGTLTLNPDGSFTYVPDNSTQGDITFQYRLKDSGGLFSAPATVTITVGNAPQPQNQKPVANGDDFSGIAAGTTGVVGNVVGNDTDPDQGDVVSFAGVVSTSAECATVFANQSPLDANGNVVFTSPAVAGTCTVTYQSKDSSGALSDPGIATITVVANQPPVATANAYTTPFDTPLTGNVLTDGTPDSDPDGDAITAVTVDVPGSATFFSLADDGSFQYTPAAGFFGQDSFTYQARDSKGALSTIATVTITVEPDPNAANRAPTAVDDLVITPFGQFAQFNVLQNDSDPDGDPIFFTTISSQPSNGTLGVGPAGGIQYVPDNGFVGNDTFQYMINDDKGATATATVTITVQAPVGSPPVAVDDVAVTVVDTPVDTNVVANDFDPDGDAFSLLSVTAPANGTTLRNGGIVRYTPNAGFAGIDTYTYTIRDSTNQIDTATVTITVGP